MGKLRDTVLIIGEGPTESYYFKSLSDVYKGITIKPDSPKHTNIKELRTKISEGINLGYTHIFCIIDMDNKGEEPERSRYAKLKAKYAKPINRPKKGIRCTVEFFETHRCTELFFLYYFKYTSKDYQNQKTLIEDLNYHVKKYEKTIKFFRQCGGLHNCFQRNGGNLDSAIINANFSIKDKLTTGRDYTYSELGRLMEKLSEFKQ